MIILKRPIITEKSMKLADKHFYTFAVDKNATKFQIAKAVTDKFSVKVKSVKTINSAGFSKAIVQLSKNQKIALFETPKEEVTVTTAEGEPIKLKEKKDILGRTKVKVEKSAVGASPTTQRKVITGK